MKTVLFILIILIYLIYSGLIEYRLLNNKLVGATQKIFQSFIIWLLPFIGAFIINWLINYKRPTGTHLDKTPSWKRLIKYDDNGFG